MSRKVRMVPENWVHPKYPDDYPDVSLRGCHVPLQEYSYEVAARLWDEQWNRWQEGLRWDYFDKRWIPIGDKYKHLRYTDFEIPRPSPDDYMPKWKEEEKTHMMMYETTTEGTPISPAFKTAEELSRWLVANKASAFENRPGDYVYWMEICKYEI